MMQTVEILPRGRQGAESCVVNIMDHGCWRPGNTRSQGIRSITNNGIDLILMEYSTQGARASGASRIMVLTWFLWIFHTKSQGIRSITNHGIDLILMEYSTQGARASGASQTMVLNWFLWNIPHKEPGHQEHHESWYWPDSYGIFHTRSQGIRSITNHGIDLILMEYSTQGAGASGASRIMVLTWFLWNIPGFSTRKINPYRTVSFSPQNE